MSNVGAPRPHAPGQGTALDLFAIRGAEGPKEQCGAANASPP